jgi:DNA modification methylase
VCADVQHVGDLLVAAQGIYGNPIDIAVWEKTEAKAGAFYLSRHEMIAVFAVGQKPALRLELGRRRLRSNVWHYADVKCSTGLIVKPLALVTDVLKDCTRKGDLVLDMFGAGTMVLAAERTGRHARALETEPRLVDLAIRRWQAATGRNAVHTETGRPFNENIADRSHRDSGEQQ